MNDEGFDEEALPTEVTEAQEDATKGRARGRGKGQGKRSSTKGSGRGRGGKKAASAGICVCPNCTAPKYPGSKFCSVFDHKCAFDNMVYQRRTRALTPQEKEGFDQRMSNDGEAGQEVEQFARDNPPECRKKQLIDFAQYVRVSGQRVGTHHQKGCKPFREKARHLHAKNVEGFSEKEAGEAWKKCLNDKSLKRDNDGFGGAERVWIPVHELDMNDREHYVDDQVLEDSDAFRAPTDTDRRMLRDLVLRGSLLLVRCFMLVSTYVHTYIQTYRHTYIHTYICTYIQYIPTYIHAYIHTHLHTSLFPSLSLSLSCFLYFFLSFTTYALTHSLTHSLHSAPLHSVPLHSSPLHSTPLHSLIHARTHTHSLTCTHKHALIHTHARTLTHLLTLLLSCSHSLTHSLTLSLSLSLSPPSFKLDTTWLLCGLCPGPPSPPKPQR